MNQPPAQDIRTGDVTPVSAVRLVKSGMIERMTSRNGPTAEVAPRTSRRAGACHRAGMNENRHDQDDDFDEYLAASAERYRTSTERFNGMLTDVLNSAHADMDQMYKSIGDTIRNLEKAHAAGEIEVTDEQGFADVLENLRAIERNPVQVPRPEDVVVEP